VVICPPFTSLVEVRRELTNSKIELGAQNLHWAEEGPYTGEVSGKFLLELGCRWVIIGHSERRRHFGETDEIVNRKLKAAQRFGLSSIVCLGEDLEERITNRTLKVVEEQFQRAFDGVDLNPEVVIAYEPVWAIGTGQNATPAQAGEVHSYIRDLVKSLYGPEASMRILYGGSVSPENIAQLMAEPEIDGVLVGGASLKAQSFLKIAKFKEVRCME
jgi:triosephosphate isomerase